MKKFLLLLVTVVSFQSFAGPLNASLNLSNAFSNIGTSSVTSTSSAVTFSNTSVALINGLFKLADNIKDNFINQNIK